MPVIVVGADTTIGKAVVAALLDQSSELRVFVSDRGALADLPATVKTAVGDVSDGTHVGSAATGAYCAVLIEQAAADDRERSFADDSEAVIAQWADGLSEARSVRVIWVGGDSAALAGLRAAAAEFAVIGVSGRNPGEIAAEVAIIEAAATLDPER
jgi:nucleoside-diphosphate-sugar epimerase